MKQRLVQPHTAANDSIRVVLRDEDARVRAHLNPHLPWPAALLGLVSALGSAWALYDGYFAESAWKLPAALVVFAGLAVFLNLFRGRLEAVVTDEGIYRVKNGEVVAFSSHAAGVEFRTRLGVPVLQFENFSISVNVRLHGGVELLDFYASRQWSESQGRDGTALIHLGGELVEGPLTHFDWPPKCVGCERPASRTVGFRRLRFFAHLNDADVDRTLDAPGCERCRVRSLALRAAGLVAIAVLFGGVALLSSERAVWWGVALISCTATLVVWRFLGPVFDLLIDRWVYGVKVDRMSGLSLIRVRVRNAAVRKSLLERSNAVQ